MYIQYINGNQWHQEPKTGRSHSKIYKNIKLANLISTVQEWPNREKFVEMAKTFKKLSSLPTKMIFSETKILWNNIAFLTLYNLLVDPKVFDEKYIISLDILIKQ